MKYFLHDSNAFNDEKITELFMLFGYEGLGLFYTFLEKIAQQEKPVKTSVLKSQLKVGRRLEKCWKFMESIGIVCSSNGDSFNEQLLKFSDKYQIKKENSRKRIANFRAKVSDVTLYESVGNTPKVKESKVKRSKESIGNFVPPSLEDITNYCTERANKINAQQFLDFYTGKGWMVGKNKMKDWQACVRTWEQRDKDSPSATKLESKEDEAIKELKAKYNIK